MPGNSPLIFAVCWESVTSCAEYLLGCGYVLFTFRHGEDNVPGAAVVFFAVGIFCALCVLRKQAVESGGAGGWCLLGGIAAVRKINQCHLRFVGVNSTCPRPEFFRMFQKLSSKQLCIFKQCRCISSK